MNLEAIVQNIDAEISRLKKARALLAGHTAPIDRGKRSTILRGGTREDCRGSEEEMGEA